VQRTTEHGPELSFLRDLPLSREAVEFARERHGEQRRESDGAPFLLHPLEAASMLDRASFPDPVVAAAVLHDVLEDTDVREAELERRFGPEVSGLVAVVSDDFSIAGDERRKEDVRERVRRAGGDALALYAADKVCKVRELRVMIANGLSAEEAKVKERRYRKALAMLTEAMPAHRLVDLLRFELEALDQLPPEAERA
jgi:(p)ppGpp synthase/HD superfamily hydrolase